jgi:RNA polymerase sigma factor (sigma-70 family)
VEPINDVIAREQGRLKHFIRRRVPTESDADDVFQEVFCELVQAYGALAPLRETGAWLYRVARNRITDLFRRRTAESRRFALSEPAEGEGFQLDAWLPSQEADPDTQYARRILLEELDVALDELPEEQRQAFVAHELEGQSFKEMAEATGIPINTLLSRKHYAVQHLRKRLQDIYKEFSDV